jgi:hypothetical protein
MFVAISDIQFRTDERIARGKPARSDRDTSGPLLATVAAGVLNHGAVGLLREEAEVLPLRPLDHGKLIAGRDRSYGNGGVRVFGEDDFARRITPVDLNRLFGARRVEGNGTERGPARRTSRLEAAFDKFRAQSDG